MIGLGPKTLPTQVALAPEAAELEAHLPPDDWDCEPDLRLPTPRPPQPEFKQGRAARRRRMSLVVTWSIGVVLLGLSLLPFMNTLGHYFVPAAHLDWIGGSLLVFATAIILPDISNAKARRLYREGLPFPVRILALTKQAVQRYNGQDIRWAFIAHVCYRNPETGLPEAASLRSPEIGTGHARFDVTYREGDVATALAMPGRIAKSMRLFGFLDLAPGVGLVKRGERSEAHRVLKAIAGVLVGAGFFAALLFAAFALEAYSPLDVTAAQVIPIAGVGGVVLGGGLVLTILLCERSARKSARQRNEDAIANGAPIEVTLPRARARRVGYFTLITFGAVLLGGAMTWVFATACNAWFDRGSVKTVTATVVNTTATTRGGIFRTYTLEVQLPGQTGTTRIASNPVDLSVYYFRKEVLVDLAPGAFGWTWIKAVRIPPS